MTIADKFLKRSGQHPSDAAALTALSWAARHDPHGRGELHGSGPDRYIEFTFSDGSRLLITLDGVITKPQ